MGFQASNSDDRNQDNGIELGAADMGEPATGGTRVDEPVSPAELESALKALRTRGRIFRYRRAHLARTQKDRVGSSLLSPGDACELLRVRPAVFRALIDLPDRVLAEAHVPDVDRISRDPVLLPDGHLLVNESDEPRFFADARALLLPSDVRVPERVRPLNPPARGPFDGAGFRAWLCCVFATLARATYVDRRLFVVDAADERSGLAVAQLAAVLATGRMAPKFAATATLSDDVAERAEAEAGLSVVILDDSPDGRLDAETWDAVNAPDAPIFVVAGAFEIGADLARRVERIPVLPTWRPYPGLFARAEESADEARGELLAYARDFFAQHGQRGCSPRRFSVIERLTDWALARGRN